ncbi:MAG: hypothetical protein E5Y04_28755 [Mesorhizobium sp.]|nr:MAG: hypothetical protein E5Y04_28755 [Mesorhizobium sp.]
MGSIDWVWWASNLWPLAVAVPGFIAFWWQWRDRALSDLARAPHIEIDATRPQNEGVRDVDGWKNVIFQIRNDGQVPIQITKVEVLSPKGVEVAMPDRQDGKARRMGRSLEVAWRVEPVLLKGDAGRHWSAQTRGFLGSTLRNISDAQISMRFTFSEMAATRRKSSVKITTAPMTLAQATKKNAS